MVNLFRGSYCFEKTIKVLAFSAVSTTSAEFIWSTFISSFCHLLEILSVLNEILMYLFAGGIPDPTEADFLEIGSFSMDYPFDWVSCKSQDNVPYLHFVSGNNIG